MDAHADRARSFALYSIGVAALLIALAALLFAFSWRQHYGPCPDIGHRGKDISRLCLTPR